MDTKWREEDLSKKMWFLGYLLEIVTKTFICGIPPQMDHGMLIKDHIPLMHSLWKIYNGVQMKPLYVTWIVWQCSS
jgi:hypothetical protein